MKSKFQYLCRHILCKFCCLVENRIELLTHLPYMRICQFLQLLKLCLKRIHTGRKHSILTSREYDVTAFSHGCAAVTLYRSAAAREAVTSYSSDVKSLLVRIRLKPLVCRCLVIREKKIDYFQKDKCRQNALRKDRASEAVSRRRHCE